MSSGYEFHPLIKDIPLPSEQEVLARMQDIREHGLAEPVVLHEGKS